MFSTYRYEDFIVVRVRNITRRLFLVLKVLNRVTVLFFLFTAPGVIHADDSDQPSLRLFEFTSEFYMPMGNGRIDGLMACNGSRQRIAIYWIEPAVYRDHTFFLGFSDFILNKDKVHYWIHGAAQPGTIEMSGEPTDQLLPRDASVISVARSAFTISNRIRSNSLNEDTPLELGKFLRESRDHADYSYEVPSEEQVNDEEFISSASDVEILNALPFGRKYSKNTQGDGTIVWRAQRVLDGPHVARVTVKLISGMQADDANSMFDPGTLGRWNLVPEPYRAYWSFDEEYLDLKDNPDNRIGSRELHEKIGGGCVVKIFFRLYTAQ